MALLERAELLGDLARFTADTPAVGGGVVLVGGEAGIGKSSLVRAFAEQADRPTLLGSCEPLSTPRPLQPLHDIAHQSGGRLAQLMASDATRHERFHALLEIVSGQTTLVVVEDVHWADDATLDLLVFLGRRLRDTPSVLVVTYRDRLAEAPPRLAQVLGHLASARSLRVAPQPLSAVAVRVLAEGHDLDPGAVHAATGGNPFFVTEVLAGRSGGLPTSVRDAVLGRVVDLSPPARAVLEAAAVVPEQVELDLLVAVSGAGDEALDECERAGLLEVGPRYAVYRHELARQAVLTQVPATRQRQLHAGVVAHLATRSGHHEARIAHHADLAGDSRTVLTYAVPAAEHAARMGAHREAGAQLQRAVAHLDAAGPVEAADVLMRVAEHHLVTGSDEAALEASERALAIQRELGDTDAQARQLALQSRILWILTRNAEARAAAAEAVALGSAAPGSRGLMAALAFSSMLHMLAREVPEALETGHRAIALARQHGDVRTLARALNAVGAASWFGLPEDVDRAAPLLVQSLETARRAQDDGAAAAAMVNLGSGAGEVRRYSLARRWLEECRDFCAARDLDANQDYALSWLARVELEQGAWDRAASLAESLLDSTSPIARIGALVVTARVRTRRKASGAGPLLDDSWELASRTGDLQRLWPVAAARAEAAWLSGRPDAVPDLVAPVHEAALRLDHPWAIGELGWWWARAGGSPGGMDRSAPPYAAWAAGQPRRAATLWDELGCPYDAALALEDVDDPEALASAAATLRR
ncbi:MAG: helix-turn-helix transcriptional regulator, partial [Mycobacterium sp.]|nr:helix-turn-helix transcriptional regulator [Mycobacterium sp.]